MIDRIISTIEKYSKPLQTILILVLVSMYIFFSTEKPSEMHILQLSLVAGIVLLALNDKEGWGWLVFVLLCIN